MLKRREIHRAEVDGGMMESDKELLELAAKAAGVEVKEWYRHPTNGWLACLNGERPFWAPLLSDGDALRLAVNLGLTLTIDNGQEHDTQAWRYCGCDVDIREEHGSDKYAATRCAIVRAAAEIGRNL